MFGSILNRLIFWELAKVFLLSLGTLTGLLVMAVMVQQAMQLGLSLGQVMRAIPLFIPNMLPYTIPATTLFASCVVYGRLSHDNEVVAIKAAGLHLASILKPALLLGILTTTITAALYHTVIPVSQQQFYQLLLDDPEEMIYNRLRRDRCIRHPSMPYVIYVRDVQGRRLIDVVLKRRGKVKDPESGVESMLGYDVVARAREAHLRVDPSDGNLVLYSDRFVIYEKNTSGTTDSPSPYKMALPDGMNGKDNRIQVTAITWGDLPIKISELQEKLADKVERRDENLRQARSEPDQNRRYVIEQQLPHFKYQIELIERSLRNIQAEYFTRPALACSCLLFALIGCPVGIWANRADYLSTFVLCFLPTLFVYYPLLLAGSGMGKDGKIPLALGCWLANIAIGTMGIVLNLRLLRR